MSEFVGELMIFVDGYQVDEWQCHEHNHPDSYFMLESGWAVGDNPRDRYCARTQSKKIRRFKDFDEAVDYVFRKRKKRPDEQFQLVYLLDRSWHRVSTLDEIAAIDAEADAQKKQLEQTRREHLERDVPGMDILLNVASHTTALQASMLLRVIRDEGEAAAKAKHPKSSYYRLMRILRQAGLLETLPDRSSDSPR